MVDWKKEYKTSDLFRRRRVAATAEPATATERPGRALPGPAGYKAPKEEPAAPDETPAEPSQSLLKKEIHLFGGKKEPKPPKERKAPKPPAESSDTPWYKREVSLKRSKPAVEAAAPAPAADDVPWYKREVSLKRSKPAAEPAAPAPAADVPWYKREVSLKRSKAAEPVEAPAPVAGTEPESEASLPWYKKEISLKRKSEREPLPESPPLPLFPLAPADSVQLPPVQEPEPEPIVPEPVAEALPEPEPEPVVRALPDPEPEPVMHVLPPVDPEPVLEVAPLEPEPEPEPEPARPVSWVDAVLEQRPFEPEPVPEPVAPLSAVPAREPEPYVAPLEPEPIAEVPALPEPEPYVARLEPEPVAEALPEAEPEPEPRAVHPPVTADELPPLEDEEPAVPWYKRELAFGRRSKAEPDFDLAAPKKPFWKRELSLGRKREAAAETEPVFSAAVSEPAEKSVPFWKKQVSFGRGAKQPKTEAAPAEKSVPFWKKELGRGAKEKAPKEAEATKPEKPQSEPFWKKSLALPGVSLPQRGGSRGAVPKQLIGLKIGASQLAAARVANNGHAEVVQVARQALDQGVIVGGELRDPEALADALKEFFKHNKLPKKGVRLGVANNRIGVRTFEISGIDDPKQLANAIRFRAQETLPIPIEEAVIDYQVLEETVNAEGEKVRKILLVVAYRELVDRYVAACRKAGIALVGIDLEAFALLRALAAPREEDAGKAAVVAVAVGHDRSTFAVSDGRVCEFTRVLEWGGQNLNVAIARALDVTPSEAEPVKHLLSLEGGPTPEGVSDEHAAAAREAAIRQVNTFARELVSSLQFYQSQPGSLGIAEIILTGGTAHLQGFAAELQRLIGVKVRIGDPLVRVKVSKRFREPEQIGSLAVAIGLGIED